MKCSKCGKESTTLVLFRGSNLCVGCGYLALENAKEVEAEVESANSEISDLRSKAEALKLNIEREKDELCDLNNRIDHLASKVSSLMGKGESA